MAAPYTGGRDQPRIVGRGPTRRHLGGHARLPLGPPGAGTVDAATMAQLEADFSEATTKAEALVIEATGLRPATG